MAYGLSAEAKGYLGRSGEGEGEAGADGATKDVGTEEMALDSLGKRKAANDHSKEGRDVKKVRVEVVEVDVS